MNDTAASEEMFKEATELAAMSGDQAEAREVERLIKEERARQSRAAK